MASLPLDTSDFSGTPWTYEEVVDAFDRVVMPQLSKAAAVLKAQNFTIIKMGRLRVTLSLVVSSRPLALNAWLYFFAYPADNAGPAGIRWKYAVYPTGTPEERAEGKIQDCLNAAPFINVLAAFVDSCCRERGPAGLT